MNMKKKTNKRIKRTGFKNELDRKFHAYVIRYNRLEKRLKSKNPDFIMYDTKLTKQQFKAQYALEIKEQRAKVVSEIGPMKMPKDITKIILDKQAFSISAKQAAAFLENWEKLSELDDRLTNEKPTRFEIRSGLAFDFDLLGEEYHTLVENGNTGKEAKRIISQTYFGSM